MDRCKLKPLQVFCPNCGHLLQGYLNDDGPTLIPCDRCGVKIYSKKKKNYFAIKVEPN